VGLLAISSEVERPLWPNFAVKLPVSGEFGMKPLYAARLGDLGPGDLVEVECVCDHSQALTASTLATAGMGKPYETIMELQRRLRCRECDEREKVVVSVRWEMGSAILC
jgi:hypothetical protein